MKRFFAGLLVLAMIITVIPMNSTSAAAGGYYSTGIYRNAFVESGKTEAQVNTKLDDMYQKFFKGDTNNQRLFYENGTDEGYIKDINNGDVRSEGQSYAMMICVQLDKKAEFDKLWKWARNHMYQTSGQYKGFFAWQCNYSGGIMDSTPASDGDEYFAMALLFAAKRWGNGTGIFNYNAEAQVILDAMLHQSDDGTGYNMFNKNSNQVVFCPSAGNYDFSDPSYHLPAFYELWALWGPERDRATWSKIAATSREFFKKTVNSTTGLNPDYANFDGTPKDVTWSTGHADFRYDAWRTASNICVDYAWWQKDAWASTTFAPKIQSFFKKEGVTSHGSNYKLDGTRLNNDHSPGLIAMNAVTALASDVASAKPFVDELWNTAVPAGQYRYYDGMLYMLGMLNVSGNFKIWGAIPEPTFLLGDINEDKNVDALDFALLKSYLLGNINTLPSMEAADFNGDGTVDSLDWAGIKRFLLGLS